MKKNKIITLAIAAVATISIIAGSTYAWFVDKADVLPVNVETAKIAVCTTSLEGDINKLPGESVIVNKIPGSVKNTGTRNGIVEVSFNDNISAKLAQAPDAAFAGDYINEAGVWKFSPSRLEQVLTMEMKEGTFESKGWVKVGDKYYAQAYSDDYADLGELHVNIGKELGGFYKDPATGVQSLSRQFEQGTVFTVGYKAKIVQCTEAAIVDTYGQTVASALPKTWYEN